MNARLMTLIVGSMLSIGVSAQTETEVELDAANNNVANTASLRGGANFAAFASAKAAQRNLAQSMARHLGSSGIHVALLIVDGMIDPLDGAACAPRRERRTRVLPHMLGRMLFM